MCLDILNKEYFRTKGASFHVKGIVSSHVMNIFIQPTKYPAAEESPPDDFDF